MPTVTAKSAVTVATQTRIFMRVVHAPVWRAPADENVPDSPFEGGEGVVSVADGPVLSVKGQPPGSLGCLIGDFHRRFVIIVIEVA
jgi:hypothetical protein